MIFARIDRVRFATPTALNPTLPRQNHHHGFLQGYSGISLKCPQPFCASKQLVYHPTLSDAQIL